MRLSNLSIRRGITVTMIYLIMIGAGIFGLTSLKIDLYPNITLPIIAVFSNYTGVGPEDIENSLTRPLEKAVISTKNIKTLSSYSYSGVAALIVEFDWGTDMNQAEIDVRKNIDMVRDYLPDEASDPTTFAFDPSMQPIQFIALAPINWEWRNYVRWQPNRSNRDWSELTESHRPALPEGWNARLKSLSIPIK